PPLSKNASYFGDAPRVVECATEIDLPLGTCGAQLFGGLTITSSYLEGAITIRFFPPVDAPRAVKSGGETNVLSSLGDRFSYSFSIPCDATGAKGAFDYTNSSSGSSGGTLHMIRLASVSCLNSRDSRLAPGDYDTVTISG